MTRGPRCEEHERRRHREIDDRRGSSTERGYGYRWQRIRARVLKEEVLCRFCVADGRKPPRIANEVDHIDGNSRNNARENLRPLCKPCHSGRTMRDQVARPS